MGLHGKMVRSLSAKQAAKALEQFLKSSSAFSFTPALRLKLEHLQVGNTSRFTFIFTFIYLCVCVCVCVDNSIISVIFSLDIICFKCISWCYCFFIFDDYIHSTHLKLLPKARKQSSKMTHSRLVSVSGICKTSS